MRVAAGAGAADDQLALEHVVERLHRRGVPGEAGADVVVGRADPVELQRVEPRALRRHQRLKRDRAVEGRDLGAVLRRRVVELVGEDQARGARHVLDDDVRIAGDVLAHVAGERARVQVVAAAGGEADADGDGLAAIEVGDGILRRCLRGQERDGAGDRQPTCAPQSADIHAVVLPRQSFSRPYDWPICIQQILPEAAKIGVAMTRGVMARGWCLERVRRR